MLPIVVFTACDPGKICLTNPIGTTDIKVIMGNLVAQALTIMGSLALLVFIVGGFMWMTAGGKEERIKKGTQAMMWAAIGIIVIFSSYAIIKLVLLGIGANPTTSYTPVSKPAEEKKNGCYCTVDGLVSQKMTGPLYADRQQCKAADGTEDPVMGLGGDPGALAGCNWYIDDQPF